VTRRRWNNNLHAFDRLLRTIPASARRGLDVGCGEGETARRLRARVAEVVGIDPDEPSIVEARSYGDDIRYEVSDLESADLEPRSFDVVAAVASLHHMDHDTALAQLARYVAPGGVLLVVGLARSKTPLQYARDGIDMIAMRPHILVRGMWHTPAPKTWPPPMTYTEARRSAEVILPGVEYRRVAHFRYTLRWTAPS
jgi:2-polyprenyl-3-methyl-5-hydroxy-6-metoxy-1,4-benzoquinol methylase